MGSYVATIHLIHELVLRDVQRREQLRRGCSNRAGRARMPRAMPGPLLGEPWAREPHLARGELGHAAHQGRPRLGRARPCRAAAQATRDGCRAAAPTGRRAARQRTAPRPPAPGSRPHRGHARRGHSPALEPPGPRPPARPRSTRAMPPGLAGAAPASRTAAGLRPPPGPMPVARARSPRGRGRRVDCSPSRGRVLAPGGRAQAARAGPPGPPRPSPCRGYDCALATTRWRAAPGRSDAAAGGRGKGRASGVEGERGTCAGSGRERRR
jgi:hypothetical protein